MIEIIKELVLTYEPALLADWKAGNRDAIWTAPLPDHVLNQPNYHFGEYYTLAWYQQRGWNGHRFHAFGDWEPDNVKYRAARADLARRYPLPLLEEFRRIRQACGRADGKGEPDLFLFRDDKTMFLEVKKEKDRIIPEQLQCLAQIRAVLGAEVGIVYLAEAGKPYQAKHYELDLRPHLRSDGDSPS